MTGGKPKVYQPSPKAHAVYRELYELYRQLHDAFGLGEQRNVMKQLIEIRQQARE
jgi:L-ribulokinase